jgi:hypothetical protein
MVILSLPNPELTKKSFLFFLGCPVGLAHGARLLHHWLDLRVLVVVLARLAAAATRARAI